MSRRHVAACALVAILAIGGNAQDAHAQDGESETGRVVGSVFLGILGGGLGGGLGGYAGAGIWQLCDDCDHDSLVPIIVGAQIGMNLGLAGGVTLGGNHEGGKGSFAVSLGLGAGSTAFGWLLINSGNGSTPLPPAFVAFGVLLPIPATAIGYWATHEHDIELEIVPTGNGAAVVGRF